MWVALGKQKMAQMKSKHTEQNIVPILFAHIDKGNPTTE